MQSTSNGTHPNPEARSNSAPQMDSRKINLATASASALRRQAIASPPATSTRTSTSSNANDYFQDAPDIGVDDLDAWGDMEEDSFFDATSEKPKFKSTPAVSTTPFDDNGEPDFAGWLAAQTQKKPGAKPLPKGLAKPATSASIAAKKVPIVAAKPVSKPVVAKKINTTPKDTGNDDGWGDGW